MHPPRGPPTHAVSVSDCTIRTAPLSLTVDTSRHVKSGVPAESSPADPSALQPAKRIGAAGLVACWPSAIPPCADSARRVTRPEAPRLAGAPAATRAMSRRSAPLSR